jgi:hypothetical protein
MACGQPVVEMGAFFGGQTVAAKDPAECTRESTSHVLRTPCYTSMHRRSCQVTAMEDRSDVSGHVPATSHRPAAARTICAEPESHRLSALAQSARHLSPEHLASTGRSHHHATATTTPPRCHPISALISPLSDSCLYRHPSLPANRPGNPGAHAAETPWRWVAVWGLGGCETVRTSE